MRGMVDSSMRAYAWTRILVCITQIQPDVVAWCRSQGTECSLPKSLAVTYLIILDPIIMGFLLTMSELESTVNGAWGSVFRVHVV